MLASSPVGIIGGGIAGLSCALRLQSLGLECVVYDTGKRGVGGRASSREWPRPGYAVDHGAQFFLAESADFQSAVAAWADAGLVKPWSASKIGRFNSDKSAEGGAPDASALNGASWTFAPFDDGKTRWVGSANGGVGGLATHMARALPPQSLQTDVWVSPSNGLRKNSDGTWSLRVNGKEIGRHDKVVLAHNGKCAHRLSEGAGADSPVHNLLAVRFNDRPDSRTMTLNSLYSLLVEVEYMDEGTAASGSSPSFEGGFVQNHPVLSWLGSNTKKYPPAKSGQGHSRREVWTLLSTASYAKQHKVPQEALEGTDACREVIASLLAAAAPFLEMASRSAAVAGTGSGGGGKQSYEVINTKLQLWGAGVPLNHWVAKDGSAFAWDASGELGTCGDWLWPQGACIEGAYMSGRTLADHIASLPSSAAKAEVGNEATSRGLDGAFASGTGGLGAVGEKAAPQARGGKGTTNTGGKGKGNAQMSGGKGGHGNTLQRSGRGGGASTKPATVNNSKKVMEMRPGDWLCSSCGAHVFASKKACFRCQKAKP